MDTDGERSREVHIAPFGYESDRIVLPAERAGADRVVLLERPGEDQPEWFADVRSALRAAGIAVEREPCDILDMYAVVEAVGRVTGRYPAADVYVNISTGSKLSAIGGMVACIAFGRPTAYYVYPAAYGDEGRPQRPLSRGVETVEELTACPVDPPSPEQLWVLAYLDERRAADEPVVKRDLLELGKANETVGDAGPETPLPFIADYSDNTSAQYRTLNDRILEPLLEADLIATAEDGKLAYVEITPEGRDTLRAFRHLLEAE